MARPKKKDWSRWIALGLYVGSAGNPEMDWEKVAKDLYDSPFNAVSLHLLSPWDNEGNYPWVFDPIEHKFDMTKPNLDWYKNVETMIDRLVYNWIGIELGFFDDYFDRRWIDDQPFKYHPFRNNKQGVDYSDDTKWFYDGWIPGRGFSWVSWVDVNLCNMKNYKPASAIGQPIINYIKRVMAIVKKVKTKYPGARIRYKAFNETKAMMEDCATGICDNPARSKGDRIEIQAFIRDLWKGYIEGAMSKPVGYVDYIAFYNGDPHVPTIAKSVKWINNCGFNLELHNAYTRQQTQTYLDAGVPQSTLFSSDGKREQVEEHYGTGDSPYFDDLKGVEALKLRNVEYKLWARYKGPKQWRVGQMMWNWNEFFPLMAQIFS